MGYNDIFSITVKPLKTGQLNAHGMFSLSLIFVAYCSTTILQTALVRVSCKYIVLHKREPTTFMEVGGQQAQCDQLSWRI